MKFEIGCYILRKRGKMTRQVLGYKDGGYILSDTNKVTGTIWLNKSVVERLFRFYE